MNNCDNCDSALNRHIFCSAKCKVAYHRRFTKGNNEQTPVKSLPIVTNKAKDVTKSNGDKQEKASNVTKSNKPQKSGKLVFNVKKGIYERS